MSRRPSALAGTSAASRRRIGGSGSRPTGLARSRCTHRLDSLGRRCRSQLPSPIRVAEGRAPSQEQMPRREPRAGRCHPAPAPTLPPVLERASPVSGQSRTEDCRRPNHAGSTERRRAVASSPPHQGFAVRGLDRPSADGRGQLCTDRKFRTALRQRPQRGTTGDTCAWTRRRW